MKARHYNTSNIITSFVLCAKTLSHINTIKYLLLNPPTYYLIYTYLLPSLGGTFFQKVEKYVNKK
jgi:hypothetical protein